MADREDDVEAYFMRRVRAADYLPLKFVSPARRGVPDRLVLGPDGWHGFVELKKPGETPTPQQRRMIRRLREQGHGVAVLNTREQVDEYVLELP